MHLRYGRLEEGHVHSRQENDHAQRLFTPAVLETAYVNEQHAFNQELDIAKEAKVGWIHTKELQLAQVVVTFNKSGE